ncbi:hypothetical protein Tco_1039445 [Tanacetum coccineum]
MEAVEKRFGGNAATKKTQRNLLKQQYENFTAPSSEMLDQTFDRLQKLVSQLELLGETISQEDVNQKLLRSLSLEWKIMRNLIFNIRIILNETVSDNEEENVSQTKIEKKIVKPSIAKIEFVKPKQQEVSYNWDNIS